jgi:multimeric flavodoxin WrbA
MLSSNGMASSKLKALGIAGSPRRNTDILLKQVMSALNRQKVETKFIFLREFNIAPCRHCGHCGEAGKCAIEDDMQWLYHDLREADFLVLASPIFFMGVTAQTKAMIDRCQALWVIKDILKLPVAFNSSRKRKGLFISVGGAELPNLFQPAIATVKSWFAILDIVYAGDLLFSGISEKGAIAQHPTALKEAFLAGRKLVEDEEN